MANVETTGKSPTGASNKRLPTSKKVESSCRRFEHSSIYPQRSTFRRVDLNGPPFAALISTDLLNEIDRDKNGKIDELVRRKKQGMAKIVVSSVNLVWLISWPSTKVDCNCKILVAKQQDQVKTPADHPDGFDVLAMESIDNVMKTLHSQDHRKDKPMW